MALQQLLTHCIQANEAEALESLFLNPEIVNDPWDEEEFRLGGGQWVHRGDTSIIVASKSGSEGLVREQLRLGAEVNARNIDGIGALMWASSNGHSTVVAVLIDNGAEVNARSNEGWDALMYASRFGHAAVAALLLDNGADPNTRNQNCTALGLAAARDHFPVCQLLLGRGADLLAVNANYKGSGNASAGYACCAVYPPLTPAIKGERREALRVAFAEGPHESQVQRRRDERWARRWPFMLVLVGSGFRPLEARRLEMALRLLSVSEPSGGEAAGAPLTRRDECVRIVFRTEILIRLIVSFL